MFILQPLYWTAVFFAIIVIPRSRSRSMLSIILSCTFSLERNRPDCFSIPSTSVVLPWSTWAIIAIFLKSSRFTIMFSSYLCLLDLLRQRLKGGTVSHECRYPDSLQRD